MGTPREIRLKSRPEGTPHENNFEVVESDVPSIEEGQVLVRTIYISVDPYMRVLMNEKAPYDFMPAWAIGQPVSGACVGQIVQSKFPPLQEGQYVFSHQGEWREYSAMDGAHLLPINSELAPIQAYLGPLGPTGLTAYVGMFRIDQPQEGETLFVSSAAGAVGSIACQIGKIKGCRVIGSTGSDQKVAWLKDTLALDGAMNYKVTSDIGDRLQELCPEGIDLYFDNVGGTHLEAALAHMKNFGRILICGMISMYNATEPVPGPSNLSMIIAKRLMLKGMILADHLDMIPQFNRDMSGWIAEGKIHWQDTIIEGVEKAPQAFIGLFSGDNIGKMLVRVSPDTI